MLVLLAVNDYRNGRWEGVLSAASFEGSAGSLLRLDCGGIPVERVELEGVSGLRISGRFFPYDGRVGWVGNWCWDGFRMDVSDAARLLALLRKEGGHLEEADSDLFDAYESGAPITAAMLAR